MDDPLWRVSGDRLRTSTEELLRLVREVLGRETILRKDRHNKDIQTLEEAPLDHPTPVTDHLHLDRMDTGNLSMIKADMHQDLPRQSGKITSLLLGEA